MPFIFCNASGAFEEAFVYSVTEQLTGLFYFIQALLYTDT